MKKGKVIKRIILILVAIILVGIIGTGLMFKNEIAIITSIKKQAGTHPFYMMEYKDGYYLNEIMDKNISSDKELASILSGYISHGFYKPSSTPQAHIGCSTLSCMDNDGNHIWGRNFDWYDSVPIVVKATPKDGYASISTCEFSNITGNYSQLPEGLGNSFLAVAAYYVPMDGVNEKGLCVADLEVNEGGQVIVDTDKKNITITMAIRLLLDKAANVEEAVELLKKYDICPSGGISSHLSISDSTGKAVVAEFMNGQISVVETPAVTNFNITNGNLDAGGESARKRFETLVKANNDANGIMSKENVTDAMQSVSQKEGEWKTRWTVIYQKQKDNDISLIYYFDGDFEEGKEIKLELKK